MLARTRRALSNLNGTHGKRLHADVLEATVIIGHILKDLMNQAPERCLKEEQLGALLKVSDFTQRHSTRTKTTWLLGMRVAAGGFGRNRQGSAFSLHRCSGNLF